MTAKNSVSIAAWRKQGLQARSALTSYARVHASHCIADRVVRSHEFIAAKSLACYLATEVEVDTESIINRAWRAKKRVFAPVIDFRGGMVFHELRPETVLERNTYGLWEPSKGKTISPKCLDVVVTPVAAFDDDRHRIGMGGGYFDRCFRFLKHRKHWFRPKLIGLAFDCQKIEKIVPNPWDIRLYRVFTQSV